MKTGTKRIGIIGAGGRGVKNLGTKIVEKSGIYNMVVAGLYDKYKVQLDAAESHLLAQNEKYGVKEPLRKYRSYKEMIDDREIDLVMVTTPQFFHMPPVVYGLEKKKRIYCDKPLAHNLSHIQKMYDTWKAKKGKGVMIGFTRRYENAWRRAKEIVDQGLIGEPRMLLLRCAIFHPSYFQTWFRKTKYSGGILNEKSAHHFDVLNWFAESRATWISAMGGRTTLVAKEGYPARCQECTLACNYRRGPHPGFNAKKSENTNPILIKDACVYSPENDIMDHAVVNVEYENGIKAQLFLNIAASRTSDGETLEVVGTDGRLRLDRHSAELDVVYNNGQETMIVDAKDENHFKSASHHGADYRLVSDLAEFVHGRMEPGVTVEEGYLATRMSMFATRSAKSHKMYKL